MLLFLYTSKLLPSILILGFSGVFSKIILKSFIFSKFGVQLKNIINLGKSTLQLYNFKNQIAGLAYPYANTVKFEEEMLHLIKLIFVKLP